MRDDTLEELDKAEEQSINEEVKLEPELDSVVYERLELKLSFEGTCEAEVQKALDVELNPDDSDCDNETHADDDEDEKDDKDIRVLLDLKLDISDTPSNEPDVTVE